MGNKTLKGKVFLALMFAAAFSAAIARAQTFDATILEKISSLSMSNETDRRELREIARQKGVTAEMSRIFSLPTAELARKLGADSYCERDLAEAALTARGGDAEAVMERLLKTAIRVSTRMIKYFSCENRRLCWMNTIQTSWTNTSTKNAGMTTNRLPF